MAKKSLTLKHGTLPQRRSLSRDEKAVGSKISAFVTKYSVPPPSARTNKQSLFYFLRISIPSRGCATATGNYSSLLTLQRDETGSGSS
jgi:hypothetical protein